MPAIDIIIPAYNSAEYLERCLYSIEQQTFIDFKVTVVNDGSTDNTPSIVERFQAKDSRFQLINQSNKGASSARNKGYDESESPLVTFVDADDFLPPDALEHLHWHITKYDNEYVVGGKKKISKKDHGSKTRVFTPELFQKSIKSESPEKIKLLRYHIAPHAKLIKRSFLLKNEIRFKEGLTYEDFIWSYTLLLRSRNVGIVSHNCYYYCINRNSISLGFIKPFNLISRWRVEQELWKICDEFDKNQVVYGNPKLTTFNARLYRNFIKIGKEDNKENEEAFVVAKLIVNSSIEDINSLTKGFVLVLYRSLYYFTYEEYINFRKNIKSKNDYCYLKGDKLYLNSIMASKLGFPNEALLIGKVDDLNEWF